MVGQSGFLARALFFIGCCISVECVFSETPGLRLKGVPNRLVLPAPAGTNLILTATLTSGSARTVWLAKKKDSKLRLFLTKVGDREYQINLADAEVAGALRAAGGANRFKIFAEVKKGQVIESLPVNFSAGYVRSPVPVFYLAYADPKSERRKIVRRVSWQQIGQEKSIEAKFNGPAPEKGARARFNEELKTFAATADASVLRLELSEELKGQMSRYGLISLQYSRGKYFETYGSLRPIPDEIEIRNPPLTVTVLQRRSGSLPGSNDYLMARLGDITAGQVMVSLHTAEGKSIIPATSLQQGQEVPFRFGGQAYSLVLKELVNVIFGTDWAKLEVLRMRVSERSKIERILKHTETAKIEFIRDGKKYTSAEGAEHLRKKLAAAGHEVKTLEDFIEKIGSKSSLTGKPYQVALPDGKTVNAGEWLKNAAKALDKPPAPKP
ncbi:MAG: DUF5329 family protein [Planctomycetota bacterium]|nr:DUF5329 family protein [Planctomycetota bacterium]